MTPCCGPGQARRALSGLLHEGKQALKAKEVSAALLAAEQVSGLQRPPFKCPLESTCMGLMEGCKLPASGYSETVQCSSWAIAAVIVSGECLTLRRA